MCHCSERECDLKVALPTDELNLVGYANQNIVIHPQITC